MTLRIALPIASLTSSPNASPRPTLARRAPTTLLNRKDF